MTGYERPDEWWAWLNLPREHPWARSVRWSCGRPGYVGPRVFFDVGELRWSSDVASLRARSFVRVATVSPDGFIRAVDVG